MGVDGWIWPVLGVHVSLVVGVLSYACRFCERNALFGARTPYSMRSDRNWREVNDRVARVVPPVSAAAGLVALSGFVAAPMRKPAVFWAPLAIQLAVLAIAALAPGATRPRPGSS